MKYSSIPSAQTIVQHCKNRGIKNIVISPGSRNAPLTIGFVHNPFFKCFSVVDERCAAFFALGIAQQLQEPVVVLCTSGSALLNYYPAVAEAFYSHIPLVVISADRPPYKIDIGDGQTIRQPRVFETHIGYGANLKQDVTHATDTVRVQSKDMIQEEKDLQTMQLAIQAYNNVELDKALQLVLTKKVPVHINAPFEEPLYNTIQKPTIGPIASSHKRETLPASGDGELFAETWSNAKKKMVLVGVNLPNTVEQRFLDELANDESVIVFTETTSNVHHPYFFPSIDSIIAPIEKSKNKEALFQELQPEVLLTFGGMVVSKKIKAFLRKYKPDHHWHVHPQQAPDTYFCLTKHFKSTVNSFMDNFLPYVQRSQSNYRAHWQKKQLYIKRRREAYMRSIPYSDLLVFGQVQKNIPKAYQVHLANSSTVRYSQLFDMDPSLTVFCNRGTSGIDGSTATAVGASVYQKNPTLFITGDLSFFYDSNALWNHYLRPDFRIVVINNSGGGIFRILPGREETKKFETFFETVHNFDASQISEMYRLEYHKATNGDELENILKTFYKKSNAPKVLEVQTPRLLNNKILLSYFDFIS